MLAAAAPPDNLGWLPLHKLLRQELELLAPTTLGMLVIGLVAVWLAVPRKRSVKVGGSKQATNHFGAKGSTSPTSPATKAADFREPNLHGTSIPSTGLFLGSPPEPYPFDNGNCEGLFLPMHRPTHDSAKDKAGDFPYGSHFKGRKRLWEMRIQFRTKKPLPGRLLIGIELEKYVPLNGAAKRMMGVTVAALKQVCGSDLYHSVGDDPSQGQGPHEKPVFMMPMWACDQLIVTPEGEEPPDLCDPDFCHYGTLRADNRAAFVKEMGEVDFAPGKTYTIGFWGISQFLDCIKWEVQKVIPFKSIDFNTFCGQPPVHVVLYTLNESTAGETRHLESRKNYFFRYALWSSLKRPSPEKIRELIPNQEEFGSDQRRRPLAKQDRGVLSKMLTCCASERPH